LAKSPRSAARSWRPGSSCRGGGTEYDELDRVVKITDARGKITDARGKITEFEFIDGLLDQVKLPANNASGANSRYIYDAIGLLTEINRDISASTQQTRVRYEYVFAYGSSLHYDSIHRGFWLGRLA
jgi:YD repeat-containing protein